MSDSESVDIIPLEKSMYDAFINKNYKDRLICIDKENEIYKKAKEYEDLDQEESEMFVFFSTIARQYFKGLQDIVN